MATTMRCAKAPFLLLALLAPAARPARANLFSLTTAGTISLNSSADSSIPVGTPWSFEIIYDAAAPDLDAEFGGSPDPTFGRFTNTGTPPAMVFFHYRAGSYEATLDGAADFGPFSEIHITFTSVNAIDININSPLFPHLAGGPVSFHADFNAFTAPPIFSSDALPTNTALNIGSFGDSTVTLLPPAGVITSSSLTSLAIAPVTVQTADFNENGRVTAADLAKWNLGYGIAGGATHSQGDANNDGRVDGDDLLVWQRQLASASATSVAIAAPEPTTVMLLAMAVVGCTLRRRFGARHRPAA